MMARPLIFGGAFAIAGEDAGDVGAVAVGVLKRSCGLWLPLREDVEGAKSWR
jgi:hypothetical protein